MTVSDTETTITQTQGHSQQQIQHPSEQQKSNQREYKKRSPPFTRNRRGGSYNRFNNRESSNNHGTFRYNQHQYRPHNEPYTIPSYIYYYAPQSPIYYPPSYDITSPNTSTATRDDEDLEIIMHDESTQDTSSDQSK